MTRGGTHFGTNRIEPLTGRQLHERNHGGFSDLLAPAAGRSLHTADVRRGLLLIATWVLGTVAATVLALSAVQVVATKVTERRVETLSPGSVNRALETPGPLDLTTTSLETTTVSTESPAGPGVATTTRRGGGRGPGSTPTTSASGSNGGSTGTGTGTGTGGTGTGGSGGSASNPPANPTTTTTRPDSCGNCRVFVGNGGWVRVYCDSKGAHLHDAWPKQGYETVIDKPGPPEVEVSFRSNSNQSIRTDIHADCTSDGQPQADIVERP